MKWKPNRLSILLLSDSIITIPVTRHWNQTCTPWRANSAKLIEGSLFSDFPCLRPTQGVAIIIIPTIREIIFFFQQLLDTRAATGGKRWKRERHRQQRWARWWHFSKWWWQSGNRGNSWNVKFLIIFPAVCGGSLQSVEQEGVKTNSSSNGSETRHI